jgi:hypothetical protein
MALVTVDDVKYVYGLIGEGDYDLVSEIIDRVGKSFDTYCDRVFESATYTEDYDGDRRDIMLEHYPVTSITSVTDRGQDWTGSTVINSSYYKISRDNRHILFSSSATLTRYRENIRIVYVAGYTTIPDDIKQACIREVIIEYKRRQKPDVTGQTMDDGSITIYADGFTQKTLAVLNRYKDKGIV